MIQILATSAKDSPEYFNHIAKSTNPTCKILLFLERETEDTVYDQRCSILKDFIDPAKPPTKEREIVKSQINHERVINCFSNLLDMWSYLMSKEPSIFRLSRCLCGHENTEEVSYLRVNHKTINECGFKALQKCLLNEENCNKQCDKKDCDFFSQSVKLQYNSHIIIETDVRDMIDLRKSQLHAELTIFQFT